ncbi:MAG TPA: hypothetical protein VF338_11085, partial [Leptolinea sp.]
MNKDMFFKFFPLIAGLALLFVKLFVFVTILCAGFAIYYSPQMSMVKSEDVISVKTLQSSTPTISPEDAAIANSEWSGIRNIKTPVIEGTPFILPTRVPTIKPDQNLALNNNTKPASISTLEISSPLEGFGVGDLQELVSQDFKAPPPGEDSGHHGVDFAFWNRGNKPILGD